MPERPKTYPTSKLLRLYGDLYSIDLRSIRMRATHHLADSEGGLAELAKNAGISRQSLHNLWSGGNVRESNLFRLLKILGLRLDQVAHLIEDDISV